MCEGADRAELASVEPQAAPRYGVKEVDSIRQDRRSTALR
jgi:hypothetical protein